MNNFAVENSWNFPHRRLRWRFFLRSYTSDSNRKKNLGNSVWESEGKRGAKNRKKNFTLIFPSTYRLTEFTQSERERNFPSLEVRKISPALKYRLHTLRTCFHRTCDHSNSNGDDSGFFLLSLSRTFTLSFRHSRAVCHKETGKRTKRKKILFLVH